MNIAKWLGTAIATIVTATFLMVLPPAGYEPVAGPGGCCPRAATIALGR